MNNIPGGSYGQRTLAPEQMPKKKNRKKKTRSGIRSIFGPVKKENIFSKIKKNFSSIWGSRKLKEHNISLYDSMNNMISLKNSGKHKNIGVNIGFSDKAMDAAGEVDASIKKYNNLKADSEILDEIYSNNGAEEDDGIARKTDHSALREAALFNLNKSKKEIDKRKSDFNNALSLSMSIEVLGQSSWYRAEVKEAEKSYNKEKNISASTYKKDLAKLKKANKNLSEKNNNALKNKNKNKASLKEMMKRNAGDKSNNDISKLKTAISISRDEIAQYTSRLKENFSQIDKLKKINKKEIKSFDQNHKKQLKELRNQWERGKKMVEERYTKLNLEVLEPVNNSV